MRVKYTLSYSIVHVVERQLEVSVERSICSPFRLNLKSFAVTTLRCLLCATRSVFAVGTPGTHHSLTNTIE